MTPQLYIDWIDYAEVLIGGGTIDWASPIAVSRLINKAQSLLPSDLIILPITTMLSTLGKSRAFASRQRMIDPLRTLLADTSNRQLILDTLTMLHVPTLALGLCTPGELAVLAASMAGLQDFTLDEDVIDDAAVYMADFLRSFASVTINAVVLFEDSHFKGRRHLYTPIEKVVTSYGWRYVVMAPGEELWPGIRSVHIPTDSKPEDVLEYVRTLRQQEITHA